MGKLFIKLLNDPGSCYDYLMSHKDNKDYQDIQKEIINKIVKSDNVSVIYRFFYDAEKLTLNDECTDLLADRLFELYSDKELNSISFLLNNQSIFEKYGDRLLNIVRNCNDLDILYRTFVNIKENDYNYVYYADSIFVSDFINLYSKTEKDPDYLYYKIVFLCANKYIDKDSVVRLFDLLSDKDKLKISRLDFSKDYFDLSLYSFDKMNEFDISDLIKHSNLDEVDKEDINRDYKRIVDRIKELNQKKEITNYKKVSSVLKNSNKMDDENRDGLIDTVLLSNDKDAIVDLFVTEEDESRLHKKETNKIVKYIEKTINYKLAFNILYKGSINKSNKKKLIDLIIKSKDILYIALTALFIDNSLIKLFKNINGLYRYLSCFGKIDDLDYTAIKEKYIELNSTEDNLEANNYIKYNVEKKVRKKILVDSKKRKK